jgi:hypothetical protein
MTTRKNNLVAYGPEGRDIVGRVSELYATQVAF